ncbi:MAG: PH domain-containing protein [Acidimicrobiales bacterium]
MLVASDIYAPLPSGRALPSLLAAGSAYLLIKSLRSGIRLDEEGLRARTTTFTRHLRWSEIDGFAYRNTSVINPGLFAHTRDDRWIKLLDYGFLRKEEARKIAAVLEEERRRRVGDAG